MNEIKQLIHNVKVLNYDQRKQSLYVEDIDRGIKFYIEGKGLVDTTVSADKFEKTEKLGKIAMVEKLVHSNGLVLTVNFIKENGDERTIRGIFHSTEPLMGRSYLTDLDKNDGHPRLVNHRAINWLILDGVKYVR